MVAGAVYGGYTVIEVDKAYGYSHVNAPGDLLIVAHIDLAEDESTEVGAAGIILSVQNTAGIFSRVHPTALGGTLRAWYWRDPSSAAPIACRTPSCDASRISHDEAGAQVCAGPTPLGTGTSACTAVTWRPATDAESTRTQLTTDVVALLKAIESGDDGVDAGDYVLSDRITIPGRENAVIPAGANLSSLLDQSIYTISQHDIEGASFVGGRALPTPAAGGLEDGKFADDIEQIGATFGVPLQILTFVTLLAVGVGMWYMVRLSGGDPRVLMAYPGALLAVGAAVTGWPPLMAVVGLTVVLTVAAAGVMTTKYWPA